jgi:hypothetical protein
MNVQERVADLLHRLAHLVDRQPCRCRLDAWMAGWVARRDMELRQLELPKSPDELDLWFRRILAESERPAA